MRIRVCFVDAGIVVVGLEECQTWGSVETSRIFYVELVLALEALQKVARGKRLCAPPLERLKIKASP
jgi:hypothetical protein